MNIKYQHAMHMMIQLYSMKMNIFSMYVVQSYIVVVKLQGMILFGIAINYLPQIDPKSYLCGKCMDGYSEVFGTKNCAKLNRHYYGRLLLPIFYGFSWTIFI